jgi:putative transposase
MSAEDRQTAVELVTEAVTNGARRAPACRVLGISLRTLQRWETEAGREDRRHGPHSGPANTLSDEEREQVVSIATSLEYRDLAPSQIVPKLADKGIYVASESSFYRILRHERLLAHRGKSGQRRYHRPDAYRATAANQVWSWDITYLRAAVRGRFYYLYLIVDVWSRKIVGWAVHEREDSELAAVLIRQTAYGEQVEPGSLILHSDNGGPMKGATMLATLQWLGIVPSFSRPRISDDNAFSEALFSTVKGRPEYPTKPFESLEAAGDWVEEFVRWYNHEHLHSAIRFVTPATGTTTVTTRSCVSASKSTKLPAGGIPNDGLRRPDAGIRWRK